LGWNGVIHLDTEFNPQAISSSVMTTGVDSEKPVVFRRLRLPVALRVLEAFSFPHFSTAGEA
jgi:hypothetical protein